MVGFRPWYFDWIWILVFWSESDPGILVEFGCGFLFAFRILVFWVNSNAGILVGLGYGYFVRIRILVFWLDSDPSI